MKTSFNILIAAIVSAGIFTACDDKPEKTYPQTIANDAPAFTATAEKSAKEIRGNTPYYELKDEPPAKLIVDPPLQHLLDKGVLWVQWRVENVNILPIFGEGALKVSPRVGHLHVQVDDLPWWWADPGNVNTIDMAGLPPGPHKVKISLVDPNHQLFPGQSKIVHFTIPEGARSSHSH